jgi:uncharacterized protein (TIGR03118 family)
MKRNTNKLVAVVKSRHKHRRWNLLLTGALLAGMAVFASAKDHDDGDGKHHEHGEGDHNHQEKSDDYLQTNLVSDQTNVNAMIVDTNLVNAWGISFSSTSPFWVSANGTGLALLYSVTNDSQGHMVVTKQGLQVTIPGEGTPTGQVFNNKGGFHGDVFLFVSEDGTISGWRPSLGMTAEVLTNRNTAVYKGVTLAMKGDEPVLLAANFAEATIDEYDTNAMLIAQFSDSDAPAGYAPFNVQSLEGIVFVTFAKQNDEKHDDVSGPGHGLIDVFHPKTGEFHRLVTGSDAGGKLTEINSPWGLAISPDSFGKHGDQLLVGNFGSGTIMAFDDDGFKGLLEGADEKTLVIDGLWGLAFGNNGKAGTSDTLFFSAGPGKENHGLFGSLTLVEEEQEEQGGTPPP